MRIFKANPQEIRGDESQNQKRIPAQSVSTLRAGVRMALREFAVKGAAGNIASGATSGGTFVIDSLFVFRQDRRTVHDLIVGSKVIQL